MHRCFLVLALGLASLSAHASEPVFPLKIAENQRYLADQKGKPFLVVGDSAWSLIVQLGEDDIDRYLDNRRKRGMNSIIVNLIEHKFCTNAPRTRGGMAPFKKAGDFSTPNSEYFDFAYSVVKKANDRGIAVWLFPGYLGYGGGDEGWFKEMKASGKANLRAYGRFVGKRFSNLPNIVWAVGGDYTPDKADQWTVSELAEGIREEDANHLMTAHGAPSSQSAVAAFGDATWLKVNGVYSYEKALYRPMLVEYERRPPRPFVLMESVYEGEHESVPEQIRRQAYWAVLSGCCGQFFGNNPIWHFDGPGLYPAKLTWQEALDQTGSRDMTRLREALAVLPWQELVPDSKHSLVTKGRGEEIAATAAARTSDKKLALVYVPSTGTEAREMGLDLGQFSGPVKGQWYNPTSGRNVPINDTPWPNRGTHTIRTPGDNGTKTNDWLLILRVP
jgi:hypothetical protein